MQICVENMANLLNISIIYDYNLEKKSFWKNTNLQKHLYISLKINSKQKFSLITWNNIRIYSHPEPFAM
jgi:hypothetical protein